MKKKIDWTEVFGATVAVLACTISIMTATMTLLNEINNVREAHNERMKLKSDDNNNQSTP